MSGGEPCCAGLGLFRQQSADKIHGLGVGGGIGPGRAPDGSLIHQRHIVHQPQTLDGPMEARSSLGIPFAPLDALKEDLLHQGGFTRAGHTGDTHKKAERDGYIDLLQIVLGCPLHPNLPLGVGFSPLVGQRDKPFAHHVLAGDGVLRIAGGAKIHDPASLFPCRRAQVQHDIALRDNLRVVLHNDDGVVEVSQLLQDLHQALVVPRVKSDAGFVQHIQRIHQRGSQGRSQGNTLNLTTGQGPRLPIQCQIPQTHVQEILQPPLHLVHDQPARLVPFGYTESMEKSSGFLDILLVHLSDRETPQAIEQRLFCKPAALALGADLVGSITGEKDTHVHLVGLPLQPIEEAPDSIVGIRSIDDLFFLRPRQPPKRNIRGNLGLATEIYEILELHTLIRGRPPGFDRSLFQ